MNGVRCRIARSRTSVESRFGIVLVAGAMAAGIGIAAGAADRPGRSCSNTTTNAGKACRFEALAEYHLSLGKCENIAEGSERSQCRHEARRALREALEECADQTEARREVCELLGQGIYDPQIDPDDFVRRVTNPFFPLVVGRTLIYEGETEDGLERVEVEVTDETKTILGVVCTQVRDIVILEGEVVEDTLDWFAQDKEGNVWYFGEISQEFEEGELVGIEGSWEAGVDGAKPGIIMKADPEVGDVYRQEFLLGEAEDLAEVIALNQTVEVELDTFEGCLQTRDFTPLEPDVEEHKFYAPGIGVVLEVNLENDERLELIDIEEAP